MNQLISYSMKTMANWAIGQRREAIAESDVVAREPTVGLQVGEYRPRKSSQHTANNEPESLGYRHDVNLPGFQQQRQRSSIHSHPGRHET